MRVAYPLVLLACATACGGAQDAGSTASWTARAEAAFAEGERLAADPGRRGEAVAAYRRAGSDFVRAFRFEAPTAERAAPRAALALRIGRAWSRAARWGSDERLRTTHGDRALFWLEHAQRLQPDLHATQFERARVLDSSIPEVGDPARARTAYEAYLATGDRAHREDAQARLEALKGR